MTTLEMLNKLHALLDVIVFSQWERDNIIMWKKDPSSMSAIKIQEIYHERVVCGRTPWETLRRNRQRQRNW